MAFYTEKTTTAKAVLKVLVIFFLLIILLVVRKNLCMTPQELALRCISAQHGLNNWDPQELCALITFLLLLLGLSYTGESILDVVVAAWENQASGAQPGAQPGAQSDDAKKKGGFPTATVIGIGAAVVGVLAIGVGIAIYTNWKVPGNEVGLRDEIGRGINQVNEDWKYQFGPTGPGFERRPQRMLTGGPRSGGGGGGGGVGGGGAEGGGGGSDAVDAHLYNVPAGGL